MRDEQEPGEGEMERRRDKETLQAGHPAYSMTGDRPACLGTGAAQTAGGSIVSR